MSVNVDESKNILYLSTFVFECLDHYILKFLPMYDEFECNAYISKDESLITFYNNRKIFFEKVDMDLNLQKNNSLSNTDLSIEINLIVYRNNIYHANNGTSYYTISTNKEYEDIDDGIIMSNSIYDMNIDHFMLFKKDFISNFAREFQAAYFHLFLKDSVNENIKISFCLYEEIKVLQMFEDTSFEKLARYVIDKIEFSKQNSDKIFNLLLALNRGENKKI